MLTKKSESLSKMVSKSTTATQHSKKTGQTRFWHQNLLPSLSSTTIVHHGRCPKCRHNPVFNINKKSRSKFGAAFLLIYLFVYSLSLTDYSVTTTSTSLLSSIFFTFFRTMVIFSKSLPISFRLYEIIFLSLGSKANGSPWR